MTIEDAQRDVRRSYAGGGPGAGVSAAVWIVAGVVTARHGVGAGFTALFLGGMLIFPLSLFIERTLMRLPPEAKGNALGRIALESTIAMIGCLFAAWLLLPGRPELAFPVAAIAVGTHYAAFRSVYGDVRFWALAALITVAGVAGVYGLVDTPTLIWIVAAIEAAFAVLLTMRARREAAGA